jgi:hypothetical protein
MTSPPTASDGTWARSSAEKAHALAERLAEVFQLLASENEPEEKEAFTQLMEASYKFRPPINHHKRIEV